MSHDDYFRCFSCSERPCNPANCTCPCHSDPPGDGSKERQDDPQLAFAFDDQFTGTTDR